MVLDHSNDADKHDTSWYASRSDRYGIAANLVLLQDQSIFTGSTFQGRLILD